ncbi:MAG: hypothetical protein SFV22_03720 [Saprospiraceae bacterium]|nr:hypothetical protein [Saprospiraceae bacterium]
MLRHFFFLLCFFCVAWSVCAQKHDNIWLFGYDYDPGGLKEGIRFQFDDSLKISYEGRAMDFAATSAFLADSSGSLRVYSNGCYVANAEGNEIEGTEGLNPGTMYNLFCAHGYGYNMPQNTIVVPAYTTGAEEFHFFHSPVTGNISKNLLTTLDLL